MLTKQERAAIAARLVSYDGGTLYFAELFECLFNREIPGDTTTKEDAEAVIDRLVELCDTSNMVELPLDKDGEVTHIGDIVYDENNKRYEVRQLTLDGNKWFVLAFSGGSCGDGYSFPVKFTHKKPATVASLNEQLRHVLDKGHMSAWSMAELFDIADKLEKLGDSDD